MFKKTIHLILFMICISFYAEAQIEKGSHVVGGSVTISNNQSNTNKMWSAYFLPQYGYFISDQLAVGAEVELGLTRFDQSANGNTTYYTTSILPFGRYYFNSLFFELSAGLSGQHQVNKVPDSGKQTNSNYYVSMAPAVGYDYFITESVALEGKLSYDMIHLTGESFDFKSLNKTLSFQVGLQVFLPSKGK